MGEGVKPEDLNTYALGRALDRLYELGPETIYRVIAISALTIYKIVFRRIHADTTLADVRKEWERFLKEQKNCLYDVACVMCRELAETLGSCRTLQRLNSCRIV